VIQEIRPLITAAEIEAMTPATPSQEPVISPTESSSRSKFLESRSATASAIPQVLRRLDQDTIRTGDRSKTLQALDTATTEGISKLKTQYAAAEDAALESLAKSLGEKQHDLQAITQKIYANSEQNDIRLSDKELDLKLQELHKNVDDVATALEKVSLGEKEGPAARSAVLKSKWL
jgi:type II secretory pathway component GspD/PulD (secretin)